MKLKFLKSLNNFLFVQGKIRYMGCGKYEVKKKGAVNRVLGRKIGMIAGGSGIKCYVLKSRVSCRCVENAMLLQLYNLRSTVYQY